MFDLLKSEVQPVSQLKPGQIALVWTPEGATLVMAFDFDGKPAHFRLMVAFAVAGKMLETPKIVPVKLGVASALVLDADFRIELEGFGVGVTTNPDKAKHLVGSLVIGNEKTVLIAGAEEQIFYIDLRKGEEIRYTSAHGTAEVPYWRLVAYPKNRTSSAGEVLYQRRAADPA